MAKAEGYRNILVVVMLEGEKVSFKFWIISNAEKNYLRFSRLQSHASPCIPCLTRLCSTYMRISLVIRSDPAIHRFSRRNYSEKSRKFYGRTPKLVSFSIKMQVCKP